MKTQILKRSYFYLGTHMKLTNKSILTGKMNTMDLPIFTQDYERMFKDWQENGKLIQEVFHMLTPEQREFIMTGVTPQEWDRLNEELARED